MEVTHIFPVHFHSTASSLFEFDVKLQAMISLSDELPNPVASSVTSSVSERFSEYSHGIIDLTSA